MFELNYSQPMLPKHFKKVYTQALKAQTSTIIEVITNREENLKVHRVEMPKAEQAQEAIKALNGSQIGGRAITVNEARPKPQRDSHGGGGFGGGGASGRW